MWFNDLTGFIENPIEVRDNLSLIDNKLLTKAGKEIICGKLTTPSLKELKFDLSVYNDEIKISEVIGDIKQIHCEDENNGAFFQVASQFNLLEMAHPSLTPEHGVAIYEYDKTQGPNCAVACGGGTIYRNYFAGGVGQAFTGKQLNTLSLIDNLINDNNWFMQNGYLMMKSEQDLIKINNQINNMDSSEYLSLKENVCIGVQSDVAVTINHSNNIVSQGFCSALPISYNNILGDWETFARMILETIYESTFFAALKNYEKTGNNKLYLTLVGGGVFGNKLSWITNAIKMSVEKFKNTPLDVRIVSYKNTNINITKMIDELWQ